MGQSRTIGAVKSYFSKNRRRLDLDRLADEAAVKMGSDMADQQVSFPSLNLSLSCAHARRNLLSRPLVHAVGFND